MTTPTPPTYWTTDDVATIYRTNPSTVRYWRHIGIGPPSFKIGKRVLYDPADVAEHIERERRRQSIER